MKRHHYLVLFVALSLLACGKGESTSNFIGSIKSIELELLTEPVVQSFEFQNKWTNSPSLKRIAKEKRTDVLLELAAQTNFPVTRHCAYFALRSFNREGSIEVGLSLALSSRIDTNILIAAVLDSLKEDAELPGFVDALVRATRVGPLDQYAARTVSLFLPSDLLSRWFESNRPEGVPSFEAYVLERLFAENRRTGVAQTPKMVRKLSSYASIPGAPRLVYVELADEREPLLRDTLRICLEDESLDDRQLSELISQRASYISKYLLSEGLNVSTELRTHIEEEVERWTRFDRKKEEKN